MEVCFIVAFPQVSLKVYKLQFVVIVMRVVTSINGLTLIFLRQRNLLQKKKQKMQVLCSRSTCERSLLCARAAYHSACVWPHCPETSPGPQLLESFAAPRTVLPSMCLTVVSGVKPRWISISAMKLSPPRPSIHKVGGQLFHSQWGCPDLAQTTAHGMKSHIRCVIIYDDGELMAT